MMRRMLHIPQIAAVTGPCIAGGAYLPALSDVIIMVEGVSFMGLGGPNLVKGATGQAIDSEALGGAHPHTAVSGVAHFMAKDDADCLRRIRQPFRQLPAPRTAAPCPVREPARAPADIYGVLPADHRLPYEIEEIFMRIFDAGDYSEFQPGYAPEMLCANAVLADS
jgi:acetyl-CoA carboxylase carboxyltransferase component